MFALFIVDAMLFHHGDKIPLGIAAQCGLAEVGVGRYEIFRLNTLVGEITAPAARHQDFLADLVGFFQHQHAPSAPGCGNSAHQARSAGAKDNDLILI